MVYFKAMTTKETADALLAGLASVIRGKKTELELFTAVYLAGGHILIDDVPGLGKTTLARTLARLIGSSSNETSFKRLQFTPDLLPYDITGVEVFKPPEQRIGLNPGPV